MFLLPALLLASSLIPTTLALPRNKFSLTLDDDTTHDPLYPRSPYPFTRLLAFGDEFSDNGNGSYAHGITGDPATVYGHGTWTNGPVAVSYLSTLLSAPLTDYAFGGCCGGGDFGATLDNAYTQSPAGAASLVDQLANYSASRWSEVRESLAVVWVGQNDLSLHTDAF
ncbi:hypothetical protein K458DRAFT_412512 [Lentithecium fluviatile CBS 122367]|uniref:Carbohydrate esterase family 16 protein n=1 Tax=Lentithecium fluviatile CBS 122367 TaxID=1168545 RepID=A0A6G1JM54_9PLEO|nr:hypothetical protein K458DRAFT_412512 [Lentithecium fluviatile CBS 122367]